jgi:hypothetical protein
MTPHRPASVWARLRQMSGAGLVSIEHVCTAAVTSTGVDGAAVTLISGPTQCDTVHASNRLAADLEECQLTLGQGPGLDAFLSGSPVFAPDLSTDEYLARWPAFTAAALSSGACAVFTVPIQVGVIRFGVLDLYRAGAGPLGPVELADALAFADVACMLMLDGSAGLNPEAAELTWQGSADATARQAHVHQATGMLLAQLGTTAEAAFARLRSYAYVHDRRLGDVARDVVERRLRFEPEAPLVEPGDA